MRQAGTVVRGASTLIGRRRLSVPAIAMLLVPGVLVMLRLAGPMSTTQVVLSVGLSTHRSRSDRCDSILT